MQGCVNFPHKTGDGTHGTYLLTFISCLYSVHNFHSTKGYSSESIISKNPTWRPLPAALHLPDALDARHPLRQLGLVYDARPARRVDEAAGLVAAVEVGRAANVLAAVLRVHPAKVHGDVAKVVDGREAVFW